MHDVKHSIRQSTDRPARVFQGSMGQRTIARVDLSRPGSAQALRELAEDWLYESVGDEGRRRLLAEHDLLVA